MKKEKTFLYTSLVLLTLTIIGVVVDTLWKYQQIQAAFPNDPRRMSEETSWLIFSVIFLLVPVLAVGLCGIRSTYKLLKHAPKGCVKIFYLISAIVSFSAFIWQTITFLGVTNFMTKNLAMATQDLILILPGLPTLIVVFILGSLPIRRNDPSTPDKTVVN